LQSDYPQINFLLLSSSCGLSTASHTLPSRERGDGDGLKGHRPRRRSAATTVTSERSVARARCSRAADGKRRLRRVY
uniref:Uncharacterized protein n=1 Tax=Aegilops tauschii subsp. strangulata TaxID=200361 RepID=A0A453LCS2_AEGTS